MFDRGKVHIVVAGDIVDHCCGCYIVPNTISGLTEERSILLWLVILLTITV